jgi:anti-sigma B factor antagonist
VDLPSIEVVHSPAECLVVLGGEIDVAAHDTVCDRVAAALAKCPDDAPTVVVDLGAVTFLDSSGIGALIEIRRQALERGQTVALRAPNARVLRVLTVARIDSLFRMEQELAPSQDGQTASSDDVTNAG